MITGGGEYHCLPGNILVLITITAHSVVYPGVSLQGKCANV